MFDNKNPFLKVVDSMTPGQKERAKLIASRGKDLLVDMQDASTFSRDKRNLRLAQVKLAEAIGLAIAGVAS